MPRKSKVGARAGRVCVTLPVSVACDLAKFQRALANVAHCMRDSAQLSAALGTFLRPREFIVDAASLQVREALL
ncbi:MAG TPA: hypothetical protein VK466_05735 [Terriglobales bacterium]|nr:hypothetical protein [Terriglobales bacterium]